MRTPTVVLVYDWLTTEYGGAEKVPSALQQAFPEAPLFTSVHNPQLSWTKNKVVKTTFLQRLPFVWKYYRWLAPFLPIAFETLTLSDYEVIISVSSFAAKGVLTKPDQLHLCYLLTPPRYLYTHQDQYQTGWLRWPIISTVVGAVKHYVRQWDRAATFRTDYLIPISELVKKRAIHSYDLPIGQVIYPPVEQLSTPETTTSSPAPYYLVVSRLVAYKRIDLAIKACQALGRDLIIVGEGPAKTELMALAQESTGQKITFMGQLEHHSVAELISNATALLMPGQEDFGITALEAAGMGTPTILHCESGAAELLPAPQLSVHIYDETVAAVTEAMIKLEKSSFNSDRLKQVVANYDTTKFISQFRKIVLQYWESWQKER